jgi:phosphoribosylamine--glycine ligase
MKILVVGGGGREHALAWKLRQSSEVTEVIVAPGNAGTALEPGVRNADVPADVESLLRLARFEKTDLTVVGPEAALVAGIVDRFTAEGMRIFGPTAAAARLEGSKAFAKEFMNRYGIPTARHAVFDAIGPALTEIRRRGAPIVIKADGLAAGKGVVVAQSTPEAEEAARAMLSARVLGAAGARLVVEDFLPGEEASFIALVDGKTILPFASSQDHKARDDGDRGPNTGGMGAYSPAPVVTAAVADRVLNEVMGPAVRGMQADGHRYVGFLYAGLMIAPDGAVKVLEFNCRLGDPETQPLLFRLKSDLSELIGAAIDGKLDRHTAQWDPCPALGVVMAAGGYPSDYRKGDPIDGLPGSELPDRKVFHAGTELREGKVFTSGGRVLCAVALGADIGDAQRKAYELVEGITWPGVQFRRDIGWRAIKRIG